jgi:hypothetical protein
MRGSPPLPLVQFQAEKVIGRPAFLREKEA